MLKTRFCRNHWENNNLIIIIRVYCLIFNAVLSFILFSLVFSWTMIHTHISIYIIMISHQNFLSSSLDLFSPESDNTSMCSLIYVISIRIILFDFCFVFQHSFALYVLLHFIFGLWSENEKINWFKLVFNPVYRRLQSPIK